MAIGYNSAVVKTPPTSFKSLLNPIYKHMVGINNSPTEAGAAFAAVYAARSANGGSLGNIGPGISYFQESIRKATSSPWSPGRRRFQSGATPIVIWWTTCRRPRSSPRSRPGRSLSPATGSTPPSMTRPYRPTPLTPAAARLWEEYLYSQAGQNQWLQGYCRPIELPTLVKNGTVNEAAYKALPPVPAGFKGYPTNAQVTAAENLVAKDWSIKVTS